MKNTYASLSDELMGKKIIAFGCGNYFRRFIYRFPNLINKIQFIIDNNYEESFYVYKEKIFPVYRPDKLKDINVSNYIIIFFANKWHEMQKQLKKIVKVDYPFFHYPFQVDYMANKDLSYYHRVVVPVVEELEQSGNVKYVLSMLQMNSIDELIEAIVTKRILMIPRIPIVLTPKCSLRCKECNNLMWKFEFSNDLSTETIKKSIKAIINCVDFLPCIELIGGEPFVAKNLKEILDFLINEPKVLKIEITTNATVIPNENIIKSLKSKKVVIHISDYSMVVNQNKFIECVNIHNIIYKKLSFEGWIATGGVKKRNRDAEELIKQYYNCQSGYLCKTLWENKLYPCARAASLAELNIYEGCPYVDVLQTESLKDKLIQFYLAPTCGPCDFCNNAIETVEYVEPAVQIKTSTGE